LFNSDTGVKLTDFPIDGIKEYNDKSITVYKGDEYAKFSYNGEQLTMFQKDGRH